MKPPLTCLEQTSQHPDGQRVLPSIKMRLLILGMSSSFKDCEICTIIPYLFLVKKRCTLYHEWPDFWNFLFFPSRMFSSSLLLPKSCLPFEACLNSVILDSLMDNTHFLLIILVVFPSGQVYLIPFSQSGGPKSWG